VSSITGGKAITLAQREGAVVERPHARVFLVESSGGGHYVVVLHARPLDARPVDSCTCKAGQRGAECSHVMAARLVVRREIDAAQAKAERDAKGYERVSNVHAGAEWQRGDAVHEITVDGETHAYNDSRREVTRVA
jgi:hypothetical protein